MLGVLATRFSVLRLNQGACHVSRLRQGFSKPLKHASVVMYSPAWVKSQSRMASNSNQGAGADLDSP